MARFQIGDNIEFLKRKDVIRKGVVVGGPWIVDKIDHYNVRWDWVDKEDMLFIPPGKVDLICDLASEKYHYRLSDDNIDSLYNQIHYLNNRVEELREQL